MLRIDITINTPKGEYEVTWEVKDLNQLYARLKQFYPTATSVVLSFCVDFHSNDN
jgi:hypothetical protein